MGKARNKTIPDFGSARSKVALDSRGSWPASASPSLAAAAIAATAKGAAVASCSDEAALIAAKARETVKMSEVK